MTLSAFFPTEVALQAVNAPEGSAKYNFGIFSSSKPAIITDIPKGLTPALCVNLI